jgi:hypothetical protein
VRIKAITSKEKLNPSLGGFHHQNIIVNWWLKHVLPALTEDSKARERALQDIETYQMHEEIKDVLVDIYFLQRQLLLGNIHGDAYQQWIDMVTTKLNTAGTKHWGWKKPLKKTELAFQLDACNQYLHHHWYEKDRR